MKLLKIEAVCEMLDVPVWRGYELARQGKLPVVRLGKQIRIDPVKLQKFIDEGGVGLDG